MNRSHTRMHTHSHTHTEMRESGHHTAVFLSDGGKK